MQYNACESFPIPFILGAVESVCLPCGHDSQLQGQGSSIPEILTIS